MAKQSPAVLAYQKALKLQYNVFPFNHTYWSFRQAVQFQQYYVEGAVWAVEAHFGYPVIYSTV